MSDFREEAEHLLAHVVEAVEEYRRHNGGLTLKQIYEMGERETMVSATADYLTEFSEEAYGRGRREENEAWMKAVHNTSYEDSALFSRREIRSRMEEKKCP